MAYISKTKGYVYMNKGSQNIRPNNSSDAKSNDGTTNSHLTQTPDANVKADGDALNTSNLKYLHLFSGLFTLDEANNLLFDPQFMNIVDYKPSNTINLSETLPATTAGEEAANTNITTQTTDRAILSDHYTPPTLISFNNSLGSVSSNDSQSSFTNFSEISQTTVPGSTIATSTPPG